MSNPEDRIRALQTIWAFRPGPATDPIDMEFVIRELDPAVRNRLVAARLDAIAKVQGNIAEMHRNIAEGAANMSKILMGKAK
jgi:hypothetical protein